MYKLIEPVTAHHNEVLELATRYENMVGSLSTLSDIRGEAVAAVLEADSSDLFGETIGEMKALLEDHEIGLCAVDIPYDVTSNPARDAVLGCLASTAIVHAVSPPVDDTKNGTPFNLYNASQSNEGKLKSAGLRYYSPEDRLGFHTDGLLRDGSIFVPNFIAVYNIMVAYRRPGNFYYLPTSLWHEYGRFRDGIGINRDVTFSMTPIVYSDKNGNIVSSDGQMLTAPIFWKGNDIETVFFNGEVDTGPADIIDLAREMTNSLLDNPYRIACPIRNRRLFVMANDRGFHARDIFADPIEGVPYTRSFLRYVSRDGHCVKAASKEALQEVTVAS